MWRHEGHVLRTGSSRWWYLGFETPSGDSGRFFLSSLKTSVKDLSVLACLQMRRRSFLMALEIIKSSVLAIFVYFVIIYLFATLVMIAVVVILFFYRIWLCFGLWTAQGGLARYTLSKKKNQCSIFHSIGQAECERLSQLPAFLLAPALPQGPVPLFSDPLHPALFLPVP